MGNQISDGYDSSYCRTTSQGSIPSSQFQKVRSEKEKIKFVIKEAYYHSRHLTRDEAELVFDEALYQFIFDDKQHEEYAPISPFFKTIASSCQELYLKARETKLYKSIIDVYKAIKMNKKDFLKASREKILELRSEGLKWFLKNIVHEQVEVKVLHKSKGFLYVTFQFGIPTRREKAEKKGKASSCVCHPKNQKKDQKRNFTGFQIQYRKKPRFIEDSKVMLVKHLIFLKDDFYLGDLLNEIAELDIEHNVFLKNSRIVSFNIWAIILDKQKILYLPKRSSIKKSKEKSQERVERVKRTNQGINFIPLLKKSPSNISIPHLSTSRSKSITSKTNSIKYK